MTDFTTFLAKLAVFKALILKDSISPEYLGTLLEEMLAFIRQNAADISSHLQSCSGMQGDISALQTALDEEITLRDTQYDDIIAKLELILGDHATQAIDNFQEIIAFLDGCKDNEKLSTQLIQLNERTSNTIVCLGFLTATAVPTIPGTYIRRDTEGDPIQIVTLDSDGITTAYPEHGKIYICQATGYIYDGIMLVPIGHRRMIIDGGTPATRTSHHIQINGGTPATRATILKQINCGSPRPR